MTKPETKKIQEKYEQEIQMILGKSSNGIFEFPKLGSTVGYKNLQENGKRELFSGKSKRSCDLQFRSKLNVTKEIYIITYSENVESSRCDMEVESCCCKETGIK